MMSHGQSNRITNIFLRKRREPLNEEIDDQNHNHNQNNHQMNYAHKRKLISSLSVDSMCVSGFEVDVEENSNELIFGGNIDASNEPKDTGPPSTIQ